MPYTHTLTCGVQLEVSSEELYNRINQCYSDPFVDWAPNHQHTFEKSGHVWSVTDQEGLLSVLPYEVRTKIYGMLFDIKEVKISAQCSTSTLVVYNTDIKKDGIFYVNKSVYVAPVHVARARARNPSLFPEEPSQILGVFLTKAYIAHNAMPKLDLKICANGLVGGRFFPLSDYEQSHLLNPEPTPKKSKVKKAVEHLAESDWEDDASE